MSDPLTEQFVAILRRELERRHMSHRDLADALGITQQSVSEMLAGVKPPSTRTMLRYLGALNLRPKLTASKQ